MHALMERRWTNFDYIARYNGFLSKKLRKNLVMDKHENVRIKLKVEKIYLRFAVPLDIKCHHEGNVYN